MLITGASGGIGLAAARAFAAEGARLVLHCHTHPKPLVELQRTLGVPACVVTADLRDEQQVERLYAETLEFVRRTAGESRRDGVAADAAAAGCGAAHVGVAEVGVAGVGVAGVGAAGVGAAGNGAAVAAAVGGAAAVAGASGANAPGPRIDVVVANAGWWAGEFVPLDEMTLEQWNATLAADLTSVFLTCRGFLRHLAAVRREAAAVVLVGSTAALFGEAGNADYAAAKAGMAYGLNLSLKNEIVRVAPRGRVNCVCPGWTRTPMADAHVSDAANLQRIQATIALRKIATPEDVAAAIVFLASERLAGHLSGVILPVSGGMEGRVLHPPA
ncbi:MAG: SDR family oxidoreductase [Planctomycetota bacterium]